MKNILLLLAILPLFVGAQTTLIPDESFEQVLIDLELDDVVDGQVLTENIASVEVLNLANNEIHDLTGIHDFLSLETLDVSENNLEELNLNANLQLVLLNCDNNDINTIMITENIHLEKLWASGNNLVDIDLSGNPALIELSITGNSLVSLDLSHNPALINIYCQQNNLTSINLSNLENLLDLICFENELTTLDFSENSALRSLFCYQNELVILDLSANSNLEDLFCDSNQLEFINLKNGNNTHIGAGHFSALDNPDLNCIEVDDLAYSEVHWGDGVEELSAFNENCGVGINEDSQFEIGVYPNPATEILNVASPINGSFKIVSLLGETVASGKLKSGLNTMNLIDLPKGVYFLTVTSEYSAKKSIQKIIIQ